MIITSRYLLSVDFVSPAGIVAETTDGALDIEESLAQGFPVVQRLQRSQIIGITFNQVSQLKEWMLIINLL